MNRKDLEKYAAAFYHSLYPHKNYYASNRKDEFRMAVKDFLEYLNKKEST